MNKINKYIKREFRDIKRRKKQCAKLYPDWRDDEYNMLECKFIWGLPSRPCEKDNPSFCTHNNATVYYNRENQRYFISIDDGFFDLSSQESQEAYVKYLLDIREAFADYMFSLDEDKKIPFEPVHISEIGNFGLEGVTLTELYCRFHAMVKGIVEYYR